MKEILRGKIIISILSLLSFARVSTAQIVWQLTDSGNAQGSKYLTSLSCEGKQCTASGYVYATTPPYKTALFFLRSSDGGLTWNTQQSPLEQIVGDYRIILKVQQIDSLNAVAVGDTAIILRTSDAGVTWVQQVCPVPARLTSVHFSDLNTGIIIGLRPSVILTTHDGGEHWTSHLVAKQFFLDSGYFPVSCHSFGGNSFKAFAYGSGPILSTDDDWSTIKTTSLLPFEIPGSADAYVFVGCHFIGHDSAIAYGNRLIVRDSIIVKRISALATTIDEGAIWNKPVEDSNLRTLTFMSQSGDRIIASSSRTGNRILVSSDRGLSWKIDSLILPNVGIFSVQSIYTTGQGSYVGFFGQSVSGGPYLGVGHSLSSHVEAIERIYHGTICYPNPALVYHSYTQCRAGKRMSDL